MTTLYRNMADYCRLISAYAPAGALDRAADEIEHLRRLLYTVCEEIEDTEQHGGGAHDDGCPVCCAIAEVRKLPALRGFNAE